MTDHKEIPKYRGPSPHTKPFLYLTPTRPKIGKRNTKLYI